MVALSISKLLARLNRMLFFKDLVERLIKINPGMHKLISPKFIMPTNCRREEIKQALLNCFTAVLLQP